VSRTILAAARRLLAATLERIPPQREGPSEAPESAETPSDEPGAGVRAAFIVAAGVWRVAPVRFRRALAGKVAYPTAARFRSKGYLRFWAEAMGETSYSTRFSHPSNLSSPQPPYHGS
jgi:hypothetical protein